MSAGKVSTRWILNSTLMLVICIVATAIAYNRRSELIKNKELIIRIDTINSAISSFHVTTGHFPASLEELVCDSPPCLNKEQLLDPWGNIFRYYIDPDGYPVVFSTTK
jgi:hypothetical protein